MIDFSNEEFLKAIESTSTETRKIFSRYFPEERKIAWTIKERILNSSPIRFFKVEGEWWVCLKDLCQVFDLDFFEAKELARPNTLLLKFLENYPYGCPHWWLVSKTGMKAIIPEADFKALESDFEEE